MRQGDARPAVCLCIYLLSYFQYVEALKRGGYGTGEIVGKFLEIFGFIDGHDGVREVVRIVRFFFVIKESKDLRVTIWCTNFTTVIVRRWHHIMHKKVHDHLELG